MMMDMAGSTLDEKAFAKKMELALNGDGPRPYCQKLAQFARAWIDCGFDWATFPHKDEIGEGEVFYIEKFVQDGPGKPFVKKLEQVPLTPTHATTRQKMEDSPADDFRRLIHGPYGVCLGVCPRTECHKFFVNVTGRKDKKYCSGKCARSVSSAKSRPVWKHRQRQQKLLRVKQAIECLDKLPVKHRNEELRKESWEVWVAERARATTQFVSRAISKGDLKSPRFIRRLGTNQAR
jgi:hypothetical protein